MVFVVEDVVIVGASVSGLSAALELVRLGVSPLLLERRAAIGRPVQCAEYVPAAFATQESSVLDFVAQRVEGLELRIVDPRGGVVVETVRAPGFVLDRDRWERHLAASAALGGAKIALAEPVEELRFSEDCVEVVTRRRTVRARVVIGADGPQSLVAAFAGAEGRKLMPALQWVVPLKKPLRTNIALFTQEVRGGYCWLFPKGRIANFGIGAWGVSVVKLRRAAEALEEYVVPTPLDFVGGLIPVYGACRPLAGDRFVLAGDAAGLTDPVTGAGIVAAFESGALAAKWTARLLAGEVDTLKGYEKDLRFILAALGRSLARRKAMEALWDDEERFVETVLRAWRPARRAGGRGG